MDIGSLWKGFKFSNHSLNSIKQDLKPIENEKPLSGKRILDVGCGAGILSMALCRLGAEVTGIDATDNAISIATKAKQTLAPQIRSNINFTFSTIEEFASEAENFESKLNFSLNHTYAPFQGLMELWHPKLWNTSQIYLLLFNIVASW